MSKIYRLLAGLWVCLLLAAVTAAPAAAAMPDATLTVAVDYTDGQHPPEDLEHTAFALRDDAEAYLTAEPEREGVLPMHRLDGGSRGRYGSCSWGG